VLLIFLKKLAKHFCGNQLLKQKIKKQFHQKKNLHIMRNQQKVQELKKGLVLLIRKFMKYSFCFCFIRIRKLSLSFLSPDEDRALVNLNNQQLPSIVIEQPEPSISNGDQQSRRTSLNKSNNDIRL